MSAIAEIFHEFISLVHESIQLGVAELNRTSLIFQQMTYFYYGTNKTFIICFIIIQHFFNDINIVTTPCNSLLLHGHTVQ